ncbi:hypothetical protein [Photorhabdus caribbeanensis]|uniref:hypothetical protein n=1 Tax=Photorhabdus caribbeanensis TaxID=1004165 RepID=UPI001BD448BF|nr:hypothetical protein [Photorhabdus caribbeanensis]MBS9425606.1 hypothetical protein [Photorhabdus caribbeanensis]
MNDNGNNTYIDENCDAYNTRISVSIGTLSVGGLIYFTLMSTLENRYQYAIVAGICLVLSAFFYYIKEKIKEKCILFQ